MKSVQTTDAHPRPWCTVSSSQWMKYPSPLAPHVLSVDVLSRTIDPKTGILHTQRLICCTQPAPSILRRLLPIPDQTYILETSMVDPTRKTHESDSQNLSMRSVIDVGERCVVRPDVADPGKTVVTQMATFKAGQGWGHVGTLVEENAASSFQKNAVKGRKALEDVMGGFDGGEHGRHGSDGSWGRHAEEVKRRLENRVGFHGLPMPSMPA